MIGMSLPMTIDYIRAENAEKEKKARALIELLERL